MESIALFSFQKFIEFHKEKDKLNVQCGRAGKAKAKQNH